MKKKLLSILTALLLVTGFSSFVPTTASAAVQRVDRTGGRDDGTWLFPLDKGYYNSFTDWAGCILGYCKLCGRNHANDGWGDAYHTYGQFNGAGHNGADIGAPYGATVMAAAAGTVRAASYMGTRGYTVIIEHPVSGANMSYYSYYQHLSSMNVSVGQNVSAGTMIGKVGNSGGNYGAHLHFGMVLAQKNCNITNSLYSIECSRVLTKADGFKTQGIILVNPSVRSVYPNNCWVADSLGYHSGSVSYTFDKNKVSIGAASSASAQTFDTITEGTYILYNRATNLALNLAWNNDANCENVHAYDYSTMNRGEFMSITACSSDKNTYKIRPVDAKRLVQMYGEKPYNGVNVCIYDDLSNSTQWWNFKKVGNGYAIFIACDTNYALSSVSGDAVLNTYTGDGSQIWELIPYNTSHTVIYNSNGGSGSMTSETLYTGKNMNLSANKFTRDGYTFLGWAKTSNATTAEYADRALVADLADGKASVTLYAVWKAIPVSTFTINYNGNGNTSGYMESDKVNVNSTVNLKKNSMKKFGYRFKGWSTDKSAKNAQYTDGQSVKNLAQSGEVTLYAVWEHIEVPQLGNIKVTSLTENSVSLSWDKVDVDGYDIYKDGDYIGKTTANTVTFTDLKPATKYEFEIMPYIENASYSVGRCKTVTTQSLPETTSKPTSSAARPNSQPVKEETSSNVPATAPVSDEHTEHNVEVSEPNNSSSSSTASDTSVPNATTSTPNTSTSIPSSTTGTPNTATSTPSTTTSSPGTTSVSETTNITDDHNDTSKISQNTESRAKLNTSSTATVDENSSKAVSDSNSEKTNNVAQTAGVGAIVSSSIAAIIHFLKKLFRK